MFDFSRGTESIRSNCLLILEFDNCFGKNGIAGGNRRSNGFNVVTNIKHKINKKGARGE